MDGFRLYKSLKLKNFLSFGDPGVELELEPLNVLIGPNGCGKSNLLSAFRLFIASSDRYVADFDNDVQEYCLHMPWQHDGLELELQTTVLDTLRVPKTTWHGSHSIRYRGGDEWSETVQVSVGQQVPQTVGRDWPEPGLLAELGRPPADLAEELGASEVVRFSRLLYDYARLSKIIDRQEDIRSLTTAIIGEQSEDSLPVLASQLATDLYARSVWLESIQKGVPDVEDVLTRVSGTKMNVYVKFRGLDTPLPAQNISDGTLRWIWLTAELAWWHMGDNWYCGGPPLYLIEEPDSGLHPDAIAHLAELLTDASRHSQLIVTTHSDVLVSALSDVPEAVVVCNRDEDGTHMRRLSRNDLADYLLDYRLGDLWRMGYLGGNP